MKQLTLFDQPVTQEAAPSLGQKTHYDWPTIDRCSAAAHERGQSLYMDALGRHYTLYGLGLGSHGWEQYETLDALCVALGLASEAA